MTGDQARFLNIGDRVCFNGEQADRGTVNDRRASDDPPRLRAAREVLGRGVPAPARSRRGGPVQAQSTIGGPGGRPSPVTARGLRGRLQPSSRRSWKAVSSCRVSLASRWTPRTTLSPG